MNREAVILYWRFLLSLYVLTRKPMKRNKASKKQKVATFKLWALPASAMPILVTFAYLFWRGVDINWAKGAAVLAITLVWAYLLGEALSKLLKIGKLSTIGYFIMLAGISVGPALVASYAATGFWIWDILWAVAPVSLISAGILRAKNARDIQAPSRCTAFVYGIEMLLPMTAMGICSIIGILPMHTIILFMTSPVSVALYRTMKRGVKEGPRPVVDLDTRTVNFLLTFSTLAIAAFVSARYFFV